MKSRVTKPKLKNPLKAKKPRVRKDAPGLILSPYCFSGPGFIDPKRIERAIQKILDDKRAAKQAATGE